MFLMVKMTWVENNSLVLFCGGGVFFCFVFFSINSEVKHPELKMFVLFGRIQTVSDPRRSQQVSVNFLELGYII